MLDASRFRRTRSHELFAPGHFAERSVAPQGVKVFGAQTAGALASPTVRLQHARVGA